MIVRASRLVFAYAVRFIDSGLVMSRQERSLDVGVSGYCAGFLKSPSVAGL
jgi:hypothetical protein